MVGSYICDRSKHIIYNHQDYETHCIKCGVPQGPILGPLLFIILLYVNEICDISTFVFKIIYVDDTSVLLSGNNVEHRESVHVAFPDRISTTY